MKKAISKIRWQAEAALNGFGEMQEADALLSARYSLERIIDALDRFDDTDCTPLKAKSRAGDKTSVCSFNSFKPFDEEPLRTPPANYLPIRDHNDSFKGNFPVDVDQNARLKESLLPLDSI